MEIDLKAGRTELNLSLKSLILSIGNVPHGGLPFDRRVADGLNRRIAAGEALAREPGLAGLLADIDIVGTETEHTRELSDDN